MDVVQDIRNQFIEKYKNKEIVNGTVELINANFEADEKVIFGKPSKKYAKNEHDWYLSQSCSIYDLKDTPDIWRNIADCNGIINSNYGHLVYSEENGNQFDNCADHLIKDMNNRQAVMIYSRPSIHTDAFTDGRYDFICTIYTHLFIRNNKLDYYVRMRSNDVIFGFIYDSAWHRFIQEDMLNELLPTYPDLEMGGLYWGADSLHIYERHFKYLEEVI
jgi:thymidylate synthase